MEVLLLEVLLPEVLLPVVLLPVVLLLVDHLLLQVEVKVSVTLTINRTAQAVLSLPVLLITLV